MNYNIFYKKEKNNLFSITVNGDVLYTPLVCESSVESLSDDIYDFVDRFDDDEYFIDFQLSDEINPIGIVLDVWTKNDVQDDPYDSAIFIFDDYYCDDDSFIDDDDDGDDYDYDDYDSYND